MTPDDRIQVYFEKDQAEVLNRQLEQYRHNEQIALRLIVSLGVTTGVSVLSSLTSLVLSVPEISGIINTLWGSGAGFETQSNVLVGAIFSFVSLFLFFYALGKFWMVLSTDNPVPLLGNEPFRSDGINLRKDEYGTEYRLYLSKNSQLLNQQSRLINAGYFLASVAVVSLIIGLVFLSSGRLLSTSDIGELNFIITIVSVFGISFLTSLLIVERLQRERNPNERNPDFHITGSNPELVRTIPLLAPLLVIIAPGILLILANAMLWWENNQAAIGFPLLNLFTKYGVAQVTIVAGVLFGVGSPLLVRVVRTGIKALSS
ncbi:MULTISPECIES: hypothetical protein [Haloferax]|uniref:Uncharacterized protein n=1 Tax=Haloferax massiliensis TaxID=1476858 RepID=A0A0D6JN63_9EURY|nr:MULTISPECIES: hypothetical protein [Haloferax]MDS0243816.1 hypothetical protein [Haloferax sp. S2CR25]MDS0446937.1 hypothetical protein [Haloferax sp. S2CR25-2]CQR49048.1 hypothetical protein BN996_00503 [Haloferax massiliensis]